MDVKAIKLVLMP